VEDKPEAGEAFGPREIAFQRFLKTRKRPIEPAAAIVDLAEAVQGIETVRLMLETFGVKPFGLGEFALLQRTTGAAQQPRRIWVTVLQKAVAYAKSAPRSRTVEPARDT
jgi:hypothetical protein